MDMNFPIYMVLARRNLGRGTWYVKFRICKSNGVYLAGKIIVKTIR